MNTTGRSWLVAANVIGYQLVWFACVAGAGRGLAWLGPMAALLFAAATLLCGGKRDADLRTLFVTLPIGIALDSAFAASGWLVYAEPWPWQGAAPAWIWALWTGFALTLNHSLAFLRDRPWLAALLGLLGGPLAYWAAAGGFDAVAFGAAPMPWVMAALALAWALALPVVFALDKRLASSGAALA